MESNETVTKRNPHGGDPEPTTTGTAAREGEETE